MKIAAYCGEFEIGVRLAKQEPGGGGAVAMGTGVVEAKEIIKELVRNIPPYF